MNRLGSIRQSIEMFARVMLVLAMLWNTALTNAIAEPGLDEIPVSIVSLDVESNTVTLAGLGFPRKEYRMAFDIDIRMLGGESGAVSGLEINDVVTALVSASDAVVHALHVVAKP